MSKDAGPRSASSSEPGRVGAGGMTTGAGELDAELAVPANRPSVSQATAPIPIDNAADGRATGAVDRDATAPYSVAGVPLPRLRTPEELARLSRSRRRALLRVGLLLLCALLVLETFYLLPLFDPSANATPRAPSPVPLAEVDPFGVNTFLHKEVDSWKKEQTFAMAKEMGVRWVKQQFPWAEIEYQQYSVDPKNAYWDAKNNQSAWGKFDTIVNLAQDNGIRLIARIDSTPSWARSNDAALVNKLTSMKLDPAKQPPLAAMLPDFAQFIHDFVDRYRGKIAAIQVWNEPNLKAEWATGQPVNATEYVKLLKTAYDAAKKADPNVLVLAAPLATNNETLAYAGNLNELDYLQALYDAGAKPYFDAMSANAYGKDAPPEDPPSRDKLNFRRVELLRDVMVKNGDQDKAVWFNEYGWNASPESIPQDQLFWGRVTDQQQADYTVRGIEYAKQNWPWAGVFTIWYLRQVGDIPPTASEFYFGLVNPDFVPSPAYKAVETAADSYQVMAGPGRWGPLSPPVRSGADWHVQLGQGASGNIALVPSATGDTLEVPFEGTDLTVELVPQTDASSGTPARYYVTVDGGSRDVSPELPRDPSGRAYIDTPVDGRAVELALVRGLGAERRTGQHTLQITVANTTAGHQRTPGGLQSLRAQPLGVPAIGAFTVEVHRSLVLFGIVTALVLLLIAGALLGLRATRPARDSAAGAR